MRIDSPGVEDGFDEAAAIAIRDARTKQALVEAIGNEAEKLRGRPQVTILYPFAHPRMVVGDFTVAERLLVMAFRAFHKGRGWSFLRPMVRVIVHPLRELEGGLTQVERRALEELMQNCGARRIAMHIGRELTMQEVELYDERSGK